MNNCQIKKVHKVQRNLTVKKKWKEYKRTDTHGVVSLDLDFVEGGSGAGGHGANGEARKGGGGESPDG